MNWFLRSLLTIVSIGMLAPLFGACTMYEIHKEQLREAEIEAQAAKRELQRADPWSAYAAVSTERLYHSLYLVGRDGMVRPRPKLTGPELKYVDEWIHTTMESTQAMALSDVERKKWGLPKLGIVATKAVDTGNPTIKVNKTGLVSIDVSAIRALHMTLSQKYFGSLSEHADFFRRLKAKDNHLADEYRSQGPVSVTDPKYTDIHKWPTEKRQTAFSGALLKSFEFMMLHEIAHVELGHLAVMKNASSLSRCGQLRSVELEADEFAALFIAEQPGLPEDMTTNDPFLTAVLGGSIGRQITLGDAKELHAGGEDAYGCKYPTVDDRQAHIRKVLSGARSSAKLMSPRVRERFCRDVRDDAVSVCSPIDGLKARAADLVKKQNQKALNVLKSILQSQRHND